MRLFALFMALTLSILMAAPAAAATCRGVAVSAAARAGFERNLNATRAARGLSPVRAHRQLNAIASRFACEMAQTGRFSHVSASGRTLQQRARAGGYRFCIIGENIAWGQKTLGALDAGWRASAGHFSNYVMRNAQDYALAGAASQNGTIYWVMLVGKSGC